MEGFPIDLKLWEGTQEGQKTNYRQLLYSAAKILEARVRIELTHKGFADLSLTTWVPRLNP